MILQSKKVIVNTFSDLRAISLSNFVNKIFSINHERMKGFLLRIISKERAEFMQGRNIAENILLVDEIIIKIKKKANLLI